jgi:predicted transcriptional regulator
MSRLADALGLAPSELLALLGDGEPIDALPPAVRMESTGLGAWDPDWIPPRQSGIRRSEAYTSRLELPAAAIAYQSTSGPMSRRQLSRGRPVRLLDVLVGSEVMTAEADEHIGPVVERMYERAYSQVPVYRGKNLVGLLTADAVARWLGSVQGRYRQSTERTTVAEVLGLAESGQPFELVRHDATVQEVLALFDQAMEAGTPLGAVLVTRDAAATGKPLGIVVVADLPRLRQHRWRR